MEYTVQAYLERRSSAELIGFLRSCMQDDRWEQYEQTVPLVLDALKNRNETIPEQIRQSWCSYISKPKAD